MTAKSKYAQVGVVGLMVLVGILMLAPGAVAQKVSEKLCTIDVSVNPPSPFVMPESGTITLIVTAHYWAGPAAEVRLLARNLPPFVTGWDNVSAHCAECTITDTIYVTPGFCSAGTYDFRLIGTADVDVVFDSLVDVYDYHLTVTDVDRECALRLADSFSIFAGDTLSFNLSAIDPDMECPDFPRTVWEYDGYPFAHGALFDDWGSSAGAFSWVPGPADVGRHVVDFSAVNGSSECRRSTIITVLPMDSGCDDIAPEIKPEPRYTQGTSNVIYYRPQCNAYEHEVCYFDFERPDVYLGCRITPNKSGSAGGLVAQLIEGLEDGHRYGYFVTAYFLDYRDSVSLSDTTSSTQDASPPHAVTKTTAVAEAAGRVLVKWYGVIDDVSYVDHYLVFRRQNGQDYVLQAAVPAKQPNSPSIPYEFRQSLTDGSGLTEGVEYHYMINAVDAVGNRGTGIETPAVVPDSTPPCMPDVRVEYDYHLFMTSYIGSTECAVWGESNCPGLQEAHYIRFQAARDSLKYFDDDWQEGYKLFTGEWLPYTDDSVGYIFNFLPPTGGPEYVHGHTYYIRAQAKDRYGNVTRRIKNDSVFYWSKPDSVKVDLLPPNDIRNLRAVSDLDFTDSSCVIMLTWEPAADPVSGVKEYLIYRNIGDGGFELIAAVDTAGYADADLALDSRMRICYRVGSRDNVGNIRDYSHTEWEACARPNLGPVIAVRCDAFDGDTCYVGGDSVRISWDAYVTDGVDHYIARYKGKEFVQDDGSKTFLYAPIIEDGPYSLKVRAVFANGTVSTWSNSVSFIRDATPPEAIDSLWLSYHPPYDVSADLRWNEPFDLSGISEYAVYRKHAPGQYALLGQTNRPRWSMFIDRDTCTAYLSYTYTVYPIDRVGNVQNTGNAELDVVCRRGPTIDTVTIDNGIITVRWSRAMPNLASQWLDSVHVMREFWVDGVAMSAETLFVVRQDNSSLFDARQFGSGYYFFQVKEVPLDLADTVSSMWSNKKGVAYDYVPPSVENLTAQPQPILPEYQFEPAGVIVISWTYPASIRPRYFRIVRYLDSLVDKSWTVIPHFLNERIVVTDSGLWAGKLYRYCISARDQFGEWSFDTCTTAIIDPVWMYTPHVKPFDPPSFNNDTLVVSWEWLDTVAGEYVVVDTTMFGAVRCSVEVCLDPTFEVPCWSARSVPAERHTQAVVIPADQLDGIRSLYVRAAAQDDYGHWSPWSTVYFGLDSVTFDNIPPMPVTVDDRLITTVADSSPRAWLLDVHLDWAPSRDVGGSLDHYVVYVNTAGAWVSIGSTAATTFIHEDVNVRGVNDGDYRYKVQPVDAAGNEQQIGNHEESLCVVPPPHALRTYSKQDLTWQYDHSADSFFAECSYIHEFLGTDLMKTLDDSCQVRIIDPSLDSLHFATGPDVVKHPTIWFHVKTVWDGNESPWSDTVSFTGDGSAGNGSPLPGQFSLDQNRPNPFNPVTIISFSLPEQSQVVLQVFNIKGELVKTLTDGMMTTGHHNVVWDGTDAFGRHAASGMYLYRLKAGLRIETKKMILLR